jgi:hypothetical protein
MKKVIFIISVIALMFTVYSCNKENVVEQTTNGVKSITHISNINQDHYWCLPGDDPDKDCVDDPGNCIHGVVVTAAQMAILDSVVAAGNNSVVNFFANSTGFDLIPFINQARTDLLDSTTTIIKFNGNYYSVYWGTGGIAGIISGPKYSGVQFTKM